MNRFRSPLIVVTAMAVALSTMPSAHAARGGAMAASTVANVGAADVLAGPTGLGPDALVAGEDAAYQAYMRGKRAFEANDYDRALVDFGDALRSLPDEQPYARSRGSVALWIARCYGLRYGLRAELPDLDSESAVLDAYAARLDAIAADDADRAAKQALVDARKLEIENERARVSGNHGDVDTQIDKSVRGEYGGVVASTWAPRVEDLAWYRRPDDPRPRGKQIDEVEPEKRRVVEDTGPRKGTGLVAAGAAVLGIGVAGIAVLGAGMARASKAETFSATQTPDQRREQIGRGTAGNTMAVTGAVAGGVAIVVGAVLVGIGVKKRKADKPRVAVMPSASRRSAALSITVRF